MAEWSRRSWRESFVSSCNPKRPRGSRCKFSLADASGYIAAHRVLNESSVNNLGETSALLLDAGFGFAEQVAVVVGGHFGFVDAVEFGAGFGEFVLRTKDVGDSDGGVAVFELVGGVVDAAVSGDRFGVLFEELAIDAAEIQQRFPFPVLIGEPVGGALRGDLNAGLPQRVQLAPLRSRSVTAPLGLIVIW